MGFIASWFPSVSTYECILNEQTLH